MSQHDKDTQEYTRVRWLGLIVVEMLYKITLAVLAMIEFLLANLKSIGTGLLVLFGISLVKKNNNLKQELKDQAKIITIQNKVADAKENDTVIGGDDVINRMLNNKE